MGVFISNSLTDRGRILLGAAQVDATFEATKIVMGSGYIPAGFTARTMTAVVAPVIELKINKKKRAGDGTVTFGGIYRNETITEAFYFREFALYARVQYADGTYSDEVLYSYGNAGDNADLMPAYSTSTVVEKQMDIVTWIGNETQVNLTVDSGLYNPHADKHAADGEDPLTPEMLGATSSAIATIEGDVSLLDGANTPGHYLFLDRNGYFGTGGGLFDVYVSKQSYDDRTSMTQTAKRTYPTNDGIDWVRYFYDVGGWTEWRQFRTADKVMVTGNIIDIDNISNDGIYNVMPTATGTFPAVLDEQPETVRKVGVLMHKIWDGNYVEQTFFSYASAKVYRRAMRNGLWAGWENMLTSGGDSTIDGSLSVNFGSGTLLSWLIENETATAMAAFRNDKVGRVHVVVYDDKSDAYLSFFDGQNWASYQMLHTGNAPAVIATAELV